MFAYRFTEAGVAHTAFGQGNQDFAILLERDGQGVIGVADGVSSAPRATDASRIATTRAMTVMSGCAPAEAMLGDEHVPACIKAAFSGARNALIDAKVKDGSSIDEWGTTLMVGLLDVRTHKAYCGIVGDGIFAVVHRDGSVAVTTPQHGARKHQTFPVVDALKWEFLEFDDVAGVICATDGIGDCLHRADVETEVVVPNELAADLFQLVVEDCDMAKETLNEILSTEAETGPFANVSDDRTLVMVVDADFLECAPHVGACEPALVEADDCEEQSQPPVAVPLVKRAKKGSAKSHGKKNRRKNRKRGKSLSRLRKQS